MSIERTPDSLLEAFTWQGGRRRTPEQIKKDQALAELLMKNGADYSPVQHWTQGGARVMSALAGVMRENRANRATLDNANASAANITNMLSGLNQQSPQGPSVIPATPPSAPQGFTPAPDAQRQPAPFTTTQTQQPSPFTNDPEAQRHPAPFQPMMPSADINQYQRALLETISGPESAGKYNVMYSPGALRYFSDFKDHPRSPATIAKGPNAGRFSDAAGKYQFLSTTWDKYKKQLGLPDFSPGSQDKAAWALAIDDYKQRSGRDLLQDLQSGDPNLIASVGKNLAGTWTSLPGGIEQGIGSNAFVNAFNRNLGPRTQQPQPSQVGLVAPGTEAMNPDLAANLQAAMGQGLTPPSAAPDAMQAQQPPANQAPIFLGDSHAAGLSRFAGGRSLGVNGANFAQSVQQLSQVEPGSQVYLSVGTNDLKSGYTEQAIRDQIKEAGRIAKERGINLTIVSPPKINHPWAQGRDDLDFIIRSAAASEGLGAFGGNRMSIAMQPDGVHAALNPQGYGAWWNAIQQDQSRFAQRPDPQVPQDPVRMASLGPTELPVQSPPQTPAPDQLAQVQPFSMNDVSMGNQALAQRPQPIMPPQAPPQAQAPQQPPVAPPQAPQSPQRPQIGPRIIQSLTNPYASPAEQAIAKTLLMQQITPQPQQFSPLPNGMVLRKDPRSGNMQVVNPYTGQVVTDPGQIPQGLRNTKFGLTPQWGMKDGKPVMIQMGDDGTVREAPTPAGIDLSPGTEKVDAGTHWVIMDKRSGNALGVVPKDVRGKEREEQVGKVEGQNIGNAPQAINQATIMLDQIKGVLDDPELNNSTGMWAWKQSIPGTAAHGFGQKMAQLQGQTFLQAYGMLKGGGAISEVEGAKAEAAIARLRTTQDPKDLRKALEELRDVVDAGRKRAEALRGPQQQQAPQTAPQVPQGPRTIIRRPDGSLGYSQ
jgi:muramidase (phage lysozyme)